MAGILLTYMQGPSLHPCATAFYELYMKAFLVSIISE